MKFNNELQGKNGEKKCAYHMRQIMKMLILDNHLKAIRFKS